MSILGDALSKGKSLVDGLLVPKYKDKDIEPITKKDLWTANITNALCKKAYERNGVTRKLVNKLANDTFDNWFYVESENQQLIDDVVNVFSAKSKWLHDDEVKYLNLQWNLKEAYKVGMVEGYALLVLGFSDDASLSEELDNPRSLDYLSILTPSDVKKLILDEDENSDTFGELIAAKVKIGKGEPKVIHASRFIFLPVNTYGNSVNGIGLVRPAYNYLTVLDNVFWSTGQSFYRYASGFPHIKKKGGTPTEMNKIKAQWKEVNSLTGWVSNDDTEIDFTGAKATALDPEKYFNVALTGVAMCFDIPVDIVKGVAAGAVTGSETNLKDYYSDISSKQQLDWTPIIEQLITILQETKQVVQGEFRIVWNPLEEMDEKEMAEIEKLKAETEKLRIEAGSLDPQEVRAVRLKESKQDSKLDQIEYNYEFPEETHLDAGRVEKIAQQYSDDITRLFSVSEIVKAIKDSEVEGILNDDYGDLEKDLGLIEEARKKKLKEAVDKNIDEAWQYGWDVAEIQLDKNIIATETALKIRKILKQSNYAFVNAVGTDVTKKTLFAVQQGILNGESISKIRKRIEPIIEGAKHNADTIARTETHRAMTKAIVQNYKDSGIVKKVKYITAGDDVVRPSHAALNGQIFDVNNLPSELDEPNCRCTVVAYFGGS